MPRLPETGAAGERQPPARRRIHLAMKKFFLLIAVALMSACAPPKKDANVNLAGYPPAFRAGYLDGCDSSKRASGQTRDDDRFKNDPQYASGWRDGYDICGKRKK
jgi:hypothetical protein